MSIRVKDKISAEKLKGLIDLFTAYNWDWEAVLLPEGSLIKVEASIAVNQRNVNSISSRLAQFNIQFAVQ